MPSLLLMHIAMMHTAIDLLVLKGNMINKQVAATSQTGAASWDAVRVAMA